jgi:hypothetical protein
MVISAYDPKRTLSNYKWLIRILVLEATKCQTAFKRGFQTRDAEMNLARLLGELGNR